MLEPIGRGTMKLNFPLDRALVIGCEPVGDYTDLGAPEIERFTGAPPLGPHQAARWAALWWRRECGECPGAVLIVDYGPCRIRMGVACAGHDDDDDWDDFGEDGDEYEW